MKKKKKRKLKKYLSKKKMKVLSPLSQYTNDAKVRRAGIAVGVVVAAGVTIRLVSLTLCRRDSKKSAGGASKKVATALAAIPLEEQERRIQAFASCPFRKNEMVTSNLHVPSYAGTREVVNRFHCKITLTGGVEGNEKVECFDFVTFDYHSFSSNPVVADVARKTVCAYGVGSCGPRGFYGTVKPHLDVEKDLALFLQTESAVVYSFSYATVATLVSCFASRGDFIVMDREVNSAVEEGCSLCRANLSTYLHRNMEDLERVLQEVVRKDSKNGPHRRLIVTEGVFANTGSICPLREIKQLADKYKFRILLDDSYGFGAIGANGRGTPEHWDMKTSDVDVYVGSLHAAMGGVGGFCAGRSAMVNFQRLSATAYVFSAALPPYVTAGTSAVLELLQNDSSCVTALKTKSSMFRKLLAETMRKKKDILICGDEYSPIVILRVSPEYLAQHDTQEVEDRLQKVVNAAELQKIAISRLIFSKEERSFNEPSLRIVIKSQVEIADLKAAVATIADVISKTMT